MYKNIIFDSDVKVKKVACIPLCSTSSSSSLVSVYILKEFEEFITSLLPNTNFNYPYTFNWKKSLQKLA